MASATSSSTILDEMRLLGEIQSNPGARKVLNSELWHACAGPLVSLPQLGSLVYYFPQGHSEQVTASTRKISNLHIPNYPTLPSQLLCQVHSVTRHADRDTDEIYAQLTLQPVNSEGDVFPIPNYGHSTSKQPHEFFCKNLTASDTSTHGGFSVPRRAAEKLFPQLDYSMQPPNQELVVRDLHDNVWTFRHIYRGQPKRHLLTTGWSLFVGTKRLKAGDSILFIRDEKSQLLLGVRRANGQQTALPSSVLSTDSMHIGVLAAAAHAAASRSPFTIYYNPRACSSEFIIPLAKYLKSVYTQVSIGMRFGMMFETEESTKRRYMGTIVDISDFDPLRWPNSKWRNLQVEWDEHGYGERPDRVNLWEIETPESPFVFPTPSLKRQCLPGFIVPEVETGFGNVKLVPHALENLTNNMHPIIPGVGSDQFMKTLLTPQNPMPDNHFRCHPSIYSSILQKIGGNGISRTLSSLPAFSMRTEAISTKQMMHQNQLPLVHQQIPPSQNILLEDQRSRCGMEKQVVQNDSASERYFEKPEEKGMAETPSERTSQEQNKECMNDSVGISCGNLLSQEIVKKSDIEPEAVTEPAEVSEKSDGVSGTDPLNLDNIVSPVVTDKEQQLKGPEIPQLQGHQLESAANELLDLASTQSSQKDNIIGSSICQSYHPFENLDHGIWIPQHSSYHSFSGHLEEHGLSNSGIPDSLTVSASDVAASPPADISCTVNSGTLNPFESFHFSCFSDPNRKTHIGFRDNQAQTDDFHAPLSIPSCIQEFFGGQELNSVEVVGSGVVSSDMHEVAAEGQETDLQKISNSVGIRALSDESISQSETYSNLQFESSNANMITGSCVSSTVLESFRAAKDSSFCVPSEDLFSSFTCNQDLQSQVTSTTMTDSQMLRLQDIPEGSGGTSSTSMDVNEYSRYRCSMIQAVQQPLRTYTKVQKLGSVGRSMDVTRFKDYHELQSAIASMFGLEGQLDGHKGSGWKLVYIDYENDVLLVGDDPWEDFVKCVRCIKILSPSEVQQMSEEGRQLMNSYLPPCS